MSGPTGSRPMVSGIIDPVADWGSEEGLLGVVKRLWGDTGRQYSILGGDGETYLRQCAWRAFASPLASVSKGEIKSGMPEKKLALEIGTHKGISTAILAQMFGHVFTIDKAGEDKHHFAAGHGINDEEREWQDRIWKYLDVRSKITPLVAENDAHKEELIFDLGFDFAFIDGDHRYEGVKLDFEAVKRCGRVAFHDYRPHVECHLEATCKVVDEAKADGWRTTLYPNFAYLERKDPEG